MKFIGDFHLHSHYSIATSKMLVPEYLDLWAKIKGITVVGTGDFTHPGWLAELEEKLAPAEEGLYRLKEEFRLHPDRLNTAVDLPVPEKDATVRFILSAEVSTIYTKKGRVRKVHHVILVPDFESARTIQRKLSVIGNITSDGRPILGLDSRNLLEIVLETSGKAFFIPAHIWTPWFSALGAKSGFDSIRECYDDLADYIHAVETGLSSDPAMNWMCSSLDIYTLISNSDAHSPENLGREANLFDTELSYTGMITALTDLKSNGFLGTIEFFPQEGKYHYDGHRKCGIRWNPVETLKNNSVCTHCGKPVTAGVMSRVMELADRFNFDEHTSRLPFYSLIPLKEILSEIEGTSPGSKRVTERYNSLAGKAGSEFKLLLHLPLSEIERIGDEIVAEAVRRMRNREVFIEEGFDGEYGRIKVFNENEVKTFGRGEMLFTDTSYQSSVDESQSISRRGFINFDLSEYKRLKEVKKIIPPRPGKKQATQEQLLLKGSNFLLHDLNPEQRRAAEHLSGPALVLAGPGTGKTRTLALRIANLIQTHKVEPENILALTFTNKAS
ncbi:MAG: UvrD-helicase domain-containing protein, partial [Spirochaetota bacterium]